MSARVENAHRIVVKIGSSLLTEGGDGTVREAWLSALADDVAALRAQGKQVMLVSSPLAIRACQVSTNRR